MTKYEELLQAAADAGIDVKELPMAGHDGLYMDGRIAINTDLSTTAERACILAEELSHHYTACGDITGTSVLAVKQEISGRRATYELLVPLEKIVDAITLRCCKSIYELAEYLDVTCEFLIEALHYYQTRYGMYKAVSGKLLIFHPLGVLDDVI